MAAPSGDGLPPTVVLLGPQRRNPGVRKAVADLGVLGPLAVVTAGWEERESEDDELARDLADQSVNLAMFPRVDEIYRHDPALQELMAERETRRKQLRDLYQLRLAPQLQVCRQLLEQTDLAQPDDLYTPEIDHAIEGVRRLDHHHLERVTVLEQEIGERLHHHANPVLVRHRQEVAELVADSSALLVAGGHVGTLLSLLRLFEVMNQAVDIPIVAWSAGSMALGQKVILFHDSPARGAGDAEVFYPGFGLIPGIIPLPHARHRLNLDDPRRVALMARRFAPDVCVGLDYTGRIDRIDGVGAAPVDSGALDIGLPDGWRASGAASVLQPNGSVITTPSGRRASPEESSTGRRPLVRPPVDCSAQRAALTEAARRGPAALRAAMAGRTFPVVGEGCALYAFVGPADAVRLHHWVSGLPSAPSFSRVPGSDLWTYVGELQDEARVEYKIEVARGNRRELIQDPLNPDQARDPFGANSVVRGPGYRRPEWTIEQPTARRGSVAERELFSSVFGETRRYSVYLPARYRPERPYPLAIIHDGIDYLNYAGLITVLDNLIHRLEIPPLIAALIQSPNRLAEYGANPRHGRFLTEDLVPHLETRHRLAGPSDRILVGASFGAVASLHAAWSHPGSFDKLLLQSGSFAFTDIGPHHLGPVFDPVVEFINRFRRQPGRPAERIFLSAGIYESLIYFNRSLLPVLQGTGARVRMVEAPDGHNWENWRDHLRDGLTWLLPGPQWLIYE